MRDAEPSHPSLTLGPAEDTPRNQPIDLPPFSDAAADPSLEALRRWGREQRLRLEGSAPLDTWGRIAARLRGD